MGSSIKPNGMASGAAALRYWERRQEISSNNLANVSTNGYKGERAFARLVENGLPRVDAVTNYKAASLTPTDNPLDIAIEGDGFIVVQTSQGERLSRGGSLSISSSNRLTDSNGYLIMGENGPIMLKSDDSNKPIDNISIAKDGSISVDGKVIDRLRTERLPPNSQLQRAGAGLFIPPQNRLSAQSDQDSEDGGISIVQGSLEESNISSIGEMVDMISIQRAYSAVQRAISTLDDARGIAVTELGKPV